MASTWTFASISNPLDSRLRFWNLPHEDVFSAQSSVSGSHSFGSLYLPVHPSTSALPPATASDNTPPLLAPRTNQPINPHNLCDRLPESFRILGVAGCHHSETAQRVDGGQGEVAHGVVEADVFRVFAVAMMGNACDWFDLLTNRLEI